MQARCCKGACTTQQRCRCMRRQLVHVPCTIATQVPKYIRCTCSKFEKGNGQNCILYFKGFIFQFRASLTLLPRSQTTTNAIDFMTTTKRQITPKQFSSQYKAHTSASYNLSIPIIRKASWQTLAADPFLAGHNYEVQLTPISILLTPSSLLLLSSFGFFSSSKLLLLLLLLLLLMLHLVLIFLLS